jgi:hypothetical protein
MENMKIKWSIIIESIGMSAIVLSLIFVGLQLQQSQIIAQTEIQSQYLENRIAANGQINDHVDVWVRGLADEKLSINDAAVFNNLLLNLNDMIFFTSLNQVRLGGTDNARMIVTDFAIFLHRNPGARRVWKARELQIAERREVIETRLSESVFELPFPYVEWVLEAFENLDESAN